MTRKISYEWLAKNQLLEVGNQALAEYLRHLGTEVFFVHLILKQTELLRTSDRLAGPGSTPPEVLPKL